MVVHPNGLGPQEAGKAWYLRKVEKLPFKQILRKVKTVRGKRPKSKHCVENAVARVERADSDGIARTAYANCGRRYGKDGNKFALDKKQTQAILAFVKKWRTKRFCTCSYIKLELQLSCGIRTIARALNRNGFFWRQIPRKSPLTA